MMHCDICGNRLTIGETIFRREINNDRVCKLCYDAYYKTREKRRTRLIEENKEEKKHIRENREKYFEEEHIDTHEYYY